MNIEDINIQEMAAKVLESKKYRESGVNTHMIEDLILQEVPKHRSQKLLLKAVRTKLHNIVAPYLGEPDYKELTEQLSHIPTSSLDSPEMRAFCLSALTQHASTRERNPYLETFFTRLFKKTGKPETILDLACGLHPLSFPWMGNLGLFFKEAHRFEKRQPGCNRQFWASLKVDHLAISLPTQNLSGTHSLLDQQRRLIQQNLPDDVQVEELLFKDEIIFLIDQQGD